jgi:hypothetical protein
MYWVKGERDVPAVYQNRHLRKAITAVLQQLYDRKYVQLPPPNNKQDSRNRVLFRAQLPTCVLPRPPLVGGRDRAQHGPV